MARNLRGAECCGIWHCGRGCKGFYGSPNFYGARQVEVADYWREWAKERLAAMVGPMDILRGKNPPNTTYRSELIARLRADAIAGKLKSEGPIVSPQIEPTLKRDIETLISTPYKQQRIIDTRKAKEQAVLALHLPDNAEFKKMVLCDL